MPVDPLSPATRIAKRNLLVVSTVTIAYEAFNVTLSKIPIAGLSIDFDSRVFGFLLLVLLTYFLTTFILYYTIDINNLPRTEHQDALDAAFKKAHDILARLTSDRVIMKIRAQLPNDANLVNSQRINHAFSNFDPRVNKHQTVGTIMDGVHVSHFNRDNRPELYEMIRRELLRELKMYHFRQVINNIILAPSVYAARSLYIVRNYIVDGIFPIALAFFALAALFQLFDVRWIRELTPPNRPLD